MRIINLSVDGIHQAAQRGLYDWLASQDADFICLQDLRALEYELDGDDFHLDGYFAYFFDSGEKHHNGIAIYTRHMPKALIYGLGFSSGVDMAGRYLQVDFEDISIGSLLAPVATDDPETQEIKAQFFDDLQSHLHKVTNKRREFIICGNWGMAHRQIDATNPEALADHPGFLEEEQQWMHQLFNDLEYTDAFRRTNRDSDEYSWWPSGDIDEGEAMRVDYQVISTSLNHKVEYAVIYKSKQFSSHLPVIVDYDIEFDSY